MRGSTVVIVLMLFFISGSTLIGRTFIVSTGGTDSNAGTHFNFRHARVTADGDAYGSTFNGTGCDIYHTT